MTNCLPPYGESDYVRISSLFYSKYAIYGNTHYAGHTYDVINLPQILRNQSTSFVEYENRPSEMPEE